MKRAGSQGKWASQGGEGDRAGSPQEVRQTELSLRKRRGASPVDGAQLQGGGQDQAPDAAGGRGGVGARGDAALQGREGPGGRGGNAGLAELIARLGQSKTRG